MKQADIDALKKLLDDPDCCPCCEAEAKKLATASAQAGTVGAMDWKVLAPIFLAALKKWLDSRTSP